MLSPRQDEKQCRDDTDNMLSLGRPGWRRTSFLDLSIQNSVPKITPLFLNLRNIFSAWSPWPRAGKEPEAEPESLISALPFPPFTFSTSISLRILSLWPSWHQPVGQLFLTYYCYFLSKHQSWAADASSNTHMPLPGFSLQLEQLLPHQAVASTQITFTLYPQAKVAPAWQHVHPFHSSADAHGKSGFP